MATAKSALRDIAENEELKEGRISRKIEQQSAKLPSSVFFGLAYGSIAGSLAIAATTRKAEWANFVGLWAPSFMLIAIYNKLVKQESSRTQSV